MKLLSMSGFIPEQICDTVRFDHYKGDKNISHLCGYVSDFISQVINEKDIDGAVFPRSCDSSRIIRSYLQETDKYVYQLEIPCSGTPYDEAFFGKIIQNYKESIEAYFKTKIDNSVVFERTSLINNRNSELRKLYNNLEDISFADYLDTVHKLLKLPLKDQIVDDARIKRSSGSKKVFVVGSFLPKVEILEKMETLGMNIVGDDLPESGRLISQKDVILQNDIYFSIAKSILQQRLSPTQNNYKEIIAKDIEEIQKKEVSGVIIITQKYCEAYDYFYSIAKKAFEEKGAKVLRLALNGTDDDEKASLLLEAFSDTL